MRYLLLLLAVLVSALVLLAGCPPPGAGPVSPTGMAGAPSDGGRDAP